MNAVFRLDASNQIGTGHFYRCLTIANRLKQKGAFTRFVCYTLPIELIEVLHDLGHEYVELKHSPEDKEDSDLHVTRHYHWIPSSQTIDAKKTIQLIKGVIWDLMIVDHYSLDSQWESLVKKHVKKIVVIDDLADRNHECDFLLDQNFYLDYKNELFCVSYGELRWDESTKMHFNPATNTHPFVIHFPAKVDAYVASVKKIMETHLHESPLL
jgi:UDP-2,4-diacetamido-2,4,6-trideoxy-beta-L-altropyranose hydrolase